MTRTLIIAVGCIVLSAVLGWLRVSGFNTQNIADRDPWETLAPPGADDAEVAQKAEGVRTGSLFTLSIKAEEALKAQTETTITGRDDAPPFPKIASVAQVNKTYRVTLIMDDGSLLSVQAGETLPSGWMIKTVDLGQVIAVFDETDSRFAVAPYLDTAFDQPEDLQTPTDAGGDN